MHYKALWLLIPVGGITGALLSKIDLGWAPVAGDTGPDEEGQRRI